MRTDNRAITTTLAYDGLNRITSKAYSDGTPGVAYSYFPGKDFPASVVSSASSYSYTGYDALGRPSGASQLTYGKAYGFTNLQWSPTGQLLSMTYPTGRVVTMALDSAGRVKSLSGTASQITKTYASGLSYAPHGAPAAMNTGSLATNDLLGVSYGYDARLRMKSVGVGTLMNLTFQYPTSNDNGNLAGQTILRGGNTIGTQSYAEFRAIRSVISANNDRRFQFKAISNFN